MRFIRPSSFVRPTVVAGFTAAIVAVALLPFASAAVADAAAPAVAPASPVSADGLPTVQVNGVVWNQVVVGTTVYAAGSFSSARPAGSAAGSNETARGNLLAYNLSTGALITSWAPSLNGQALAIAASPDGSRIYVGGDFTSVNGTTRNRIAALDATTGALVGSFAAGVNGRVRALAVTADTLYAGGSFTSTGGNARSRLAAYATANGALRPWAPAADQEVMALLVPGANNEIVIGGHFTTLNGVTNRGMGAVDLGTGAGLAWPVNQTIQNWGPDAAIWSLSTDGTQVYGTGYGYLVRGTANSAANLENAFAATLNGDLVWVNGCYGDTYSSFPQNGVLYSVGHPHNCSAIGGHPQTTPWTFQRALAVSTARGANNAVNTSGALAGQPAPDLLHWLPTLAAGSFTGQAQAAWSVAGNGQYVVLGGEFVSVNGVAQQGLVRFASTAIAPNKQGPQLTSTLTPTAISLVAGRVRVSWQAAWDRDNRNLSYEVLRGATLASSTVIGTLTQDSTWWNRPNLYVNDSAAPAGSSQTYRIRVSDAFGNTAVSGPTTLTVPTAAAASSYANQVLADGATHLWRLNEPSGTVGYDSVAADDLILDASAGRGADGALVGETGSRSTSFSGTATVPAVSPVSVPGPQAFGLEAWFRTSSTTGGKIIGFGNSQTGDSTSYDRHVYLTDAGNVVFGVYQNQVKALTSPLTYNDGQWHHVVASLGSAGAQLYVDGRRVGRDASATGAEDHLGYWRIGGDNLGGWPNQPTSSRFTGSIEDAAIYPAPLTQAQVQAHYQAGGGTLNLPARPADAYGAAVWDANPAFYWRLDETAGTVAADRMTNLASGGYSGGVVLGSAGSPASGGGTAVTFPGTSAQTVVAGTAVDNPTVYSLETWFRTSTTRGGRLIGFGNAQSGSSSNYDRYVYMLNDGTLRYGIWTGNAALAGSAKAYNDGAWHQVVATQGPNGMALYVDGELVGTNPAVTPQGYTGYWRLGTDNTWGGADSNDFAGSIDEAAVYDDVLPAATIAQHYQLGKPGQVGQPVPANQKPVAAFTSTATDLAVSFDAGGSADPDGTVAAYAWDFGDGSTSAAAAPAHTYPAAGSYTVTLTVTDDRGATGTVSRAVSVTAAPAALAADTFTRTVVDGLGGAETGGSWTLSGTGSNFAVTGGRAALRVPTAGAGLGATLNSVSATGADLAVTAAVDRAATGNGTYVWVTGRRTAAGEYRGRVRLLASGGVAVQVGRFVNGTETVIGTESTVSGLSYTAGTALRIRLQVEGTGSTSLRLKVWRADQPEPAAWAKTATDGTAGFQGAGSVGLATYLSGSSTNAPVTVSFDDFQVGRL